MTNHVAQKQLCNYAIVLIASKLFRGLGTYRSLNRMFIVFRQVNCLLFN